MAEIGWDDVATARDRIRSFVHRTPVFTSRSLNSLSGATIFWKCENFQRTGSFKFRGASNAVAGLSPKERRRGVMAHSSGNHAQALAHAAHLHGIAAHIVMPENASLIKRSATQGYGARVILCPPTHAGREEVALRIQQETGAVFIHPHDDLHVIAGQGTCVVELLEEVGELDLVLVPVGGGGLLSGTLLAIRHLQPAARVIGCEPEGADDAARSLQTGQRILDFVPHTIADGLRTPLGENTFEIIRRSVDDIVTVTEQQIVAALRLLWERLKIVVEPSSAVAAAPLFFGSILRRGTRVGVILSGGNVDAGAYFHDLAA